MPAAFTNFFKKNVQTTTKVENVPKGKHTPKKKGGKTNKGMCHRTIYSIFLRLFLLVFYM